MKLKKPLLYFVIFLNIILFSSSAFSADFNETNSITNLYFDEVCIESEIIFMVHNKNILKPYKEYETYLEEKKNIEENYEDRKEKKDEKIKKLNEKYKDIKIGKSKVEIILGHRSDGEKLKTFDTNDFGVFTHKFDTQNYYFFKITTPKGFNNYKKTHPFRKCVDIIFNKDINVSNEKENDEINNKSDENKISLDLENKFSKNFTTTFINFNLDILSKTKINNEIEIIDITDNFDIKRDSIIFEIKNKNSNISNFDLIVNVSNLIKNSSFKKYNGEDFIFENSLINNKNKFENLEFGIYMIERDETQLDFENENQKLQKDNSVVKISRNNIYTIAIIFTLLILVLGFFASKIIKNNKQKKEQEKQLLLKKIEDEKIKKSDNFNLLKKYITDNKLKADRIYFKEFLIKKGFDERTIDLVLEEVFDKI